MPNPDLRKEKKGAKKLFDDILSDRAASTNQNFMTFETLKTENEMPMRDYQLA